MHDLCQIKQLKLSYKEKTLIHDLSFNIKRNEILALVGESGSGKTLTGLSLLNLIEPPLSIDSGEVIFHDYANDTIIKKTNILKSSQAELLARHLGKRVAMIFQDASMAMSPLFNVGWHLKQCLKRIDAKMSRNEIKDKSISLLKTMQISSPESRLKSYPYHLSGGIKQRVMLAMALAVAPDLLVADEPTTALDVTVQKEIVDLLVDVSQKQNMSLLFISHDIALVSNIADRIGVMKDGRLVELSSKDQIINHAKHAYTKKLIGNAKSI